MSIIRVVLAVMASVAERASGYDVSCAGLRSVNPEKPRDRFAHSCYGGDARIWSLPEEGARPPAFSGLGQILALWLALPPPPFLAVYVRPQAAVQALSSEQKDPRKDCRASQQVLPLFRSR
jgi:hypothetical protein